MEPRTDYLLGIYWAYQLELVMEKKKATAMVILLDREKGNLMGNHSVHQMALMKAQ